MNLMEKFNSIELTADTRISETDRTFCQAQKKAYDQARSALKFMAEQGQKYHNEQNAILESVERDAHSTYLGKFDPTDFTKELHMTHHRFIVRLFEYFVRKYKVSLDHLMAENVLLPKEPQDNIWRDSNDEELLAYGKEMDELSLDYQQVLDQIFIQLGGDSFQDKAVQEIKEGAHDAAWNRYHGKKNYELKRAVISFTDYACSFDSWHEQFHKGEHRISLPDSMKKVIRALSYFEFSSIDLTSYWLSILMGYSWETRETEMHLDLSKIKSIKCFKNGRVDIRFTNEGFARQFAEEYLGTEI